MTEPSEPSSEFHSPPAREFPFARYFLLASLLVMGAATSMITWFAVEEVRGERLQASVAYAEEIVHNLFHQIEREYLEPLLERGETYDCKDPREVEELGAVVDRAIFGFHVQKLYFFDTGGLIIYSTQRSHIGLLVPQENEPFYTALGGRTSWVLKRRNDPLDISRSPTGKVLLETYVPVRSRLAEDPESVAGVIEIYQDVERLNAELARSRLRIITLSLCGLGAMLLVFAVFIIRADRTIRDRRRELVRSNRALQDLSRNLESLVDRRSQQLIEQEKLASLGGLAAGLAHELNTPLATMAACAEGSSRHLDTLGESERERLQDLKGDLELIRSEAFHCKGIIRSLLAYARQGTLKERAPIDLNELVEQTLVLLRLHRRDRRTDVRKELGAPLSPALGDAGQIRQVIHNLVQNALYAVRERENPRVALRTFSDDRHVTFECEDNGEGVPPQVRDKIFDPFFTTKPPREGIGLGLAVSYSIVQRHGGSLELCSSNGKSTVFRLVLPSAPE